MELKTLEIPISGNSIARCSLKWQEVLRNLIGKYLNDPEPLLGYLIDSPYVTYKPFNHGDWICRAREMPDRFWLVDQGAVDIIGDFGAFIKTRPAGSIIGEQAFLLAVAPMPMKTGRAAGMRANGATSLISFGSELIAQMSDPVIRAAWFEFLAQLVNEKLNEATDERAAHINSQIGTRALLNRFCDPKALELVEMALQGGVRNAPIKDTVIFFSDLAGFSGWSKGKASEVVAENIRELMGLQVDLIHKHNGGVDKLMGDGLMGFWFINPLAQESILAPIQCAIEIREEFRRRTGVSGGNALALRIGMHCGEVCFGDFGTDDRIAVTLIGEAVNLAARFEQLHNFEDGAIPGTVRISDTLFDRIKKTDEEIASLFSGPKEGRVKQDICKTYWIED